MENARLGIIFLVLVMASLIGLAFYVGGGNEPAAAPAVVVPPVPAASSVAVVPVAPAPTVVPPVALPPAITKIAAAARNTPMSRPMNRVIKSWLGCHDKQAYLDTMAMLSRNDPASASQFTGEHAACMMLTEGQKVGVAALDDGNHLVQVNILPFGERLWTDPSALDGTPSS